MTGQAWAKFYIILVIPLETFLQKLRLLMSVIEPAECWVSLRGREVRKNMCRAGARENPEQKPQGKEGRPTRYAPTVMAVLTDFKGWQT